MLGSVERWLLAESWSALGLASVTPYNPPLPWPRLTCCRSEGVPESSQVLATAIVEKTAG